MSSSESSNRAVRSHSIHVVVNRDYRRIKMAQKQDIKLEQDFLKLERKMMSHAKWNERADNRNLQRHSTCGLNNAQDSPAMTLDEYLARNKIKQENIGNAKKVANENIRRFSKTST